MTDVYVSYNDGTPDSYYNLGNYGFPEEAFDSSLSVHYDDRMMHIVWEAFVPYNGNHTDKRSKTFYIVSVPISRLKEVEIVNE